MIDVYMARAGHMDPKIHGGYMDIKPNSSMVYAGRV